MEEQQAQNGAGTPPPDPGREPAPDPRSQSGAGSDRGGQAPAGDELSRLNAELEACAKEKQEYLDGWKRAKADLINYKREELTRAEELVKFSNAELLRQLLEIADSFDLALQGVPPDGEKGLRLIKGQLESFLMRQGLEPIAAFDEQFNPALHEAIAEVESEKPAGVVVEEVGRGWLLHGRVLRPARVKVSK